MHLFTYIYEAQREIDATPNVCTNMANGIQNKKLTRWKRWNVMMIVRTRLFSEYASKMIKMMMREAKENEDDEKKEDKYGRWDKRSRMMKVILKLITDRDNNIFIAFFMPIIIMSFHY